MTDAIYKMLPTRSRTLSRADLALPIPARDAMLKAEGWRLEAPDLLAQHSRLTGCVDGIFIEQWD